ncbi:MAG: hypothetical protein AB8I08_10140 [Sandaracinaceae bacterium]
MTVSFAVGTGRCGTTFLATLAGLEPDVAASHERLRRAATFHMFCKWHGIDVDPSGFLGDRQRAVDTDLSRHRVSFESSALLSHSIAELAQRFDARFVLLVRNPHDTVASFAARGWFLAPIPWEDANLPPTLPDAMEPRHFFGRNLPRGPELDRWRALTQVGKLAWFWRERNLDVLRQFATLPAERRTVVRLEELDLDRYGEVARVLGWEPTISAARFEALAAQRLNTGPRPVAPARWSARETREFEREAGPLATALGFERSTSKRLAGCAPLGADIRPSTEQALAAYFAQIPTESDRLFPPGGSVRVWRFVHPDTDESVELTWSGQQVEREGRRTERSTFHTANALITHVRDELEALALDGFRLEGSSGGPPWTAAGYARIDFAAIEARIARELPSRGAWLVQEVESARDSDHDWGEDDAYLDDDTPERDEDTPDFEVRRVESLDVDEAFQEPIKEGPFDLDPRFARPSALDQGGRDDSELEAFGGGHVIEARDL